MNWEAIKFDWNQVRGFLATAEEGSLSGGARALGLTQPTLGRQVAALEQSLGVVLFERVGRSLALTPSGLELLEHVHTMAEAASRISLTASGQSQAIEGKVRITASDIFSVYLLPPAIAQLHEIAPLLDIEVVADDTIVDLQHREADIAIRHVRPEQPELIAKLVTESTARLYASQAYLDRAGCPRSPTDLAGHDMISFGNAEQMIGYLAPLGYHLTSANFRLGSKNGVVAWQFVREGLGMCVMDDKVAASHFDVVPVFPDMAPIVFPIWLTTHRELHTSRRIRLVFDHLAEHLAKIGT